MKIKGIYFSGTGNTKWVADTLQKKLIEAGHDVDIKSIELVAVKELKESLIDADLLIVLHPAYGNDMPNMLEEYLQELSKHGPFEHLKGLAVDVPALYSADGALASKFFFDDCGIEIIGAYNVYLSCNFDTIFPMFRIDSEKTMEKKLNKAHKKINTIISNITSETVVYEKCHNLNKWLGRMEKGPNKKMMKDYQIKVNKDLCIACGKCVKLCPLDNFELIDDQYVKTKGNCTICLRCINECPTYAIRFFNEKGSKPYKQFKGPK